MLWGKKENLCQDYTNLTNFEGNVVNKSRKMKMI